MPYSIFKHQIINLYSILNNRIIYIINGGNKITLKLMLCFFFLDWCMICIEIKCRHYQMGGTRVVCIGQWWTKTKRGDHWPSLCAQKKTRWWDPHNIYLIKSQEKKIMGMVVDKLGSTQISHGQICCILPKTTIELMSLPSKASFIGFFPLTHQPTSSYSCIYGYFCFDAKFFEWFYR